jgi:hypothetical protein
MINKKVSALLVAVLLFFCARDGQIAGTTTETSSGTKASIYGYVFTPDSIKPVNGAYAVLYNLSDRNYSIDTTAKSSVITDTNGSFVFDSVDTGNFFVSLIENDSLGAAACLKISRNDSLINISETLSLCGRIFGRIDTSEFKNKGNYGVYIPEIGKRKMIDSTGYFRIPNIPTGQYHVRLSDNNSLLSLTSDTNIVPILSGQRTIVTCIGKQSGSISVYGNIEEK